MPQGQIRKGFFFYFGLFVLLLVTVFLICLVIMIFNPGKTVLWMQYFSGDGKNVLLTKTNDEDKGIENIDWKSVTNLHITCSYANVIVEKNLDKALSEDGLFIKNNAKGFCAAAEAQPFGYNLYREGNKIFLEVQEPNGFLYFSNEIKVILHAKYDSSWNFNNLNLTVETKNGDVEIGGNSAKLAEKINLATLNVSTDKGNVSFTENFNSNSIKDFENSFVVTTNSGKIYSNQTVSYVDMSGTQKTATGLSLNCNPKFAINDKGQLSFKVLNLPGKKLQISSIKGTLTVDYINAADVSILCKQGNHLFGQVLANLSYTNSQDSILSPNIMVDYIRGNFILKADGTSAEPDIDIKKIDGTIDVIADKGALKVKSAAGQIGIVGKAFGVNVVVAENNTKAINIKNEGGGVYLGFVGTVANGTSIETIGGAVEIDITSAAQFTATMKKNEEGNPLLEESKINVNIGNEMLGGQSKNPLIVRSGTSELNIITNANVRFNLKNKNDLLAE